MKLLSSCCHKTKACLWEMHSRVSKLFYTRFASLFSCTTLSLMWVVSFTGSAPAHILLTMLNVCSLTTASQQKQWEKVNSWFHLEEMWNMHLNSSLDFELSAQAGYRLLQWWELYYAVSVHRWQQFSKFVIATQPCSAIEPEWVRLAL